MSEHLANPADAPLYPIREVSRLTGVNAVTLRAWERRYALIRPQRTPKGHRLYARGDIERIERILQWLNRGVSVSQVGDLLDRPQGADPTPTPSTPAIGDWAHQRQQLVAAVEALDLAQLDMLFDRSLALYPVDICLAELWQPTIVRLEERWDGHLGDALQRHALETFLRTRIGTRLYHANLAARGPRLLLAPLPESGGPLWSLLFALAGSHAGYHVQLFDGSLPHGELALSVERLHLAAVMLVSQHAERSELIRGQLPRLAMRLPVPLCLAGAVTRIRAADLEASRVALLGDEPLRAVERLDALLA